MAHIHADNLHIQFPIYHGHSRSLKRTVLAATNRRVKEDARNRITVHALKNISFDLRPGDRLGLIGDNGAGKTTLLRTLAGIYEPVEGRLEVSGRVGALLDPNLGMNGELTGRENIALRALFIGMSRAEAAALEADVQNFAELGEFLDLPVRLYSMGMGVRLGFALATALRPQVLLMDEWFLAGDAAFMEKARTRLEQMVRGAEILVLSSHSTPVVMEWCTRVVRLEHGAIIDDGTPEDVIGRYLNP